jgi:hypothetical protein
LIAAAAALFGCLMIALVGGALLANGDVAGERPAPSPTPGAGASPTVAVGPIAPERPAPDRTGVLLLDTFDDPNSGFGARATEGYTRGYESGQYVVRFRTQDTYVAAGPVKVFADFRVEVDCFATTVVANGACGIVFRWQEAAGGGDSWHKFQVDPGTGSVRFVTLRNDSQERNWLVWVPHPAVARGTDTNRLTAIADGFRITLLVNGAQVGSFDDPTYREGLIGLIAHGYTVPSEWRFDNLRVTALR